MLSREALLRTLLIACLPLGACVPCAAGTTAQPAPRTERQYTAMVSALSGGGERFGDAARCPTHAYLAIDNEIRTGLSETSDIGVRLASAVGFATMWGAGFINGGHHAHVESTLLLSGVRRSGLIFGPRFPR